MFEIFRFLFFSPYHSLKTIQYYFLYSYSSIIRLNNHSIIISGNRLIDSYIALFNFILYFLCRCQCIQHFLNTLFPTDEVSVEPEFI